MARLPQPGGDSGSWGAILNEFLSQVHNTDGTLKPSVVKSENLAPNAVSATSLITVTGGSDGQVLTLDSSAPGGLGGPALARLHKLTPTGLRGVV